MREDYVNVLLNQHKYPNNGVSCTSLLPIKVAPSQTIAGFKMGKYFYDAMLKDNKSYQVTLKDDHRFKSLFILSVNSSSASFF